MSKNKVYTHVSLFSGAGGLDIGLEQAGFHTVWANDFNHDACETHRLWSNATVIEGNIGKVDYDTIPDCDIASFGFPCQGFSLSGLRKVDDSRNVLYRHCVKLVEKKQPKLFLAENVKGLLTLGGGKIKDAIIADFESKGYVVSINLVNAADYHVPEDRQRILLVGIRKDLAEKYGVEFKVPAPFPDRISIRQALEELAPAAEDETAKKLSKCATALAMQLILLSNKTKGFFGPEIVSVEGKNIPTARNIMNPIMVERDAKYYSAKLSDEVYDTQYAVSEHVIECWEDGPVPPIVINSSIWAIVESTAAEMQKDNRFLRRKEILDTEFLEVSARIYNELLGFAARKYEILDIGE